MGGEEADRAKDGARARGRRGKRPDRGEKGVGEAIAIGIGVQLNKFAKSEATELKFSSCMSSQERAHIHTLAAKMGLKSKSRGKGVHRYATVYKRSGSTLVQKDARLSLNTEMRDAVAALLASCPITPREKDDLAEDRERERTPSDARGSAGLAALSGSPLVPKVRINPEVLAFKMTLPVYEHRRAILDAIEENQVIVVVGETGSGKTTQIPQYILERAQEEKRKCKIVCTQPRRIAAVSVAERVAYERGEKVGESVGYQIRLESRTTAKTVLTYCTNGVLLRSLMSLGSSVGSATHVVVDEVHERDKLSDFLLISLKDLLSKCRGPKVILMSATIDAEIFSRYFNNCPIVSVPGKLFPVRRYFLEDVLAVTQYSTKEMKKIEKELRDVRIANEGTSEETAPEPARKPETLLNVDAELQAEMDDFLNDCFVDGSEDAFGQILYMYTSENVPVNCAHSGTGMTGLMVAAHRGKNDVIEEILQLGGDPIVEDLRGKKAIDYATDNGKTDSVEFLSSIELVKRDADVQDFGSRSSSVDDATLESYSRSVPPEAIDHDLILELVKNIHLNQSPGSILIFMPGYDDIMTMKETIEGCNELLQSKYQIFILHSNMQIIDQKRIFNKLPGVRKIFISTNIAETSITIDDVVYVIDSAKAKETYYDSIMGVRSLEVVWVSKSRAIQRAGRAGRTQPGKVYMMCSKRRYEYLPDDCTPEILRIPLHDLCLHTKYLAPNNTPIADFLSKALEPPSFSAIRNSVSLLKTIGALTPTEDLTEIGHNLLDLSIEPQLGKMLLYACVLKCLDPILTIVCTISYKEPFEIPVSPAAKKTALDAKNFFSQETLSDHMILLRSFQAWQNARANNSERSFCHQYSINSATMKMVESLRIQILSQLRAIGLVKAKGPGDIKDCNQNSEKWYVVKAVLVAGLYPSIARVDRDCTALRTSKDVNVAFHRGSVLQKPGGKRMQDKFLASLPTDWIVFEEVTRNSQGYSCKSFIRSNTIVTGLTVALFGGPLRLPTTALHSNLSGASEDSDSEEEEAESVPNDLACFSIDDWIVFTASPQDALSIYLLRQKFSALMIRRMQQPGKQAAPGDDKVITAIVNVLGLEEKNYNLAQPTIRGIVQRPRMY